MRTANRVRDKNRVGNWCWLFPVTYLIHIGEEMWGGEGFPAWLARIMDVGLSPQRFLAMNLAALLLMVVGIILAIKTKSLRWILVSLGALVLINGLLHLFASAVTASYSPGLVSGMLLWMPLGAVTLMRLKKILSRRAFRAGATVGVAIHGVVFLLTFFSGTIL